jgi:hypothetical protein
MCSIVHEPCNVVLRHFRQLLLEDAFEAGEYDVAGGFAIIVDDSKLDDTFALLDNCRLSQPLGEFASGESRGSYLFRKLHHLRGSGRRRWGLSLRALGWAAHI